MEVKEQEQTTQTHESSSEALALRPIGIKKKPVYSFFKRSFDIICSLFGLVLLSVPFLLIMLIIYIDSPGASPVYSQKRIGKNGKSFNFYKFRSMVPNAEAMLEQYLDQNEMQGPVFKIKHDPRITRVGRVIRKTSIDEFPQLWNVLKGDMSLVGPRPPLPREVEQYTEYQLQRLSVTPGITCYWQIQPRRNSLSFDELQRIRSLKFSLRPVYILMRSCL